MVSANQPEIPHVFGLLTRSATIGTSLAAIAVNPTNAAARGVGISSNRDLIIP